jgi:ATP-dependent protease HslVU (ClpYQ) ATPase subunit
LPDGVPQNGGFTVDAQTVRDRLKAVVEDEDLRRYIL